MVGKPSIPVAPAVTALTVAAFVAITTLSPDVTADADAVASPVAILICGIVKEIAVTAVVPLASSTSTCQFVAIMVVMLVAPAAARTVISSVGFIDVLAFALAEPLDVVTSMSLESPEADEVPLAVPVAACTHISQLFEHVAWPVVKLPEADEVPLAVPVAACTHISQLFEQVAWPVVKLPDALPSFGVAVEKHA